MHQTRVSRKRGAPHQASEPAARDDHYFKLHRIQMQLLPILITRDVSTPASLSVQEVLHRHSAVTPLGAHVHLHVRNLPRLFKPSLIREKFFVLHPKSLRIPAEKPRSFTKDQI